MSRSSFYRIGEMGVISPDFYLSNIRSEEGSDESCFTPTDYDFGLIKEAWGDANAHLEEWCKQRDSPMVVFLCGIPASGKSTYLRKTENRFGSTWSDRLPVFGRHQTLKHSEDILFFDATFTSPFGRKKTIEIIMNANSNSRIGLVKMQCSYETCLERNSQRSKDRIIPVEVMERMKTALEDNPPLLSEGFEFIATTHTSDGHTKD